jgi:hypothetical protein
MALAGAREFVSFGIHGKSRFVIKGTFAGVLGSKTAGGAARVTSSLCGKRGGTSGMDERGATCQKKDASPASRRQG